MLTPPTPAISALDALEAKYAADNAARRDFLKDKSPEEVLLWMMRCGDTDPQTRARCAVALLQYQSEGKDAIKPADQT